MTWLTEIALWAPEAAGGALASHLFDPVTLSPCTKTSSSGWAGAGVAGIRVSILPSSVVVESQSRPLSIQSSIPPKKPVNQLSPLGSHASISHWRRTRSAPSNAHNGWGQRSHAITTKAKALCMVDMSPRMGTTVDIIMGTLLKSKRI